MWTASADITKPEAETALTEAVKAGAIGLGEIKSHVAADGPELRRMYALAAELNVSIMVHFQEVPHFDGEGVFATGFSRFEAMLKMFPKTRFIGHADAFWANVSADYANEIDYPSGPIKRGGITDRLLATTRICSAICRPTPETTRSHAIRSSPATSCGAIRTNSSSGAIARASTAAARVWRRRTTPARAGWRASVSPARRWPSCSDRRRPTSSANWSGATRERFSQSTSDARDHS